MYLLLFLRYYSLCDPFVYILVASGYEAILCYFVRYLLIGI
jgi:hypothetical protein